MSRAKRWILVLACLLVGAVIGSVVRAAQPQANTVAVGGINAAAHVALWMEDPGLFLPVAMSK